MIWWVTVEVATKLRKFVVPHHDVHVTASRSERLRLALW